MVSDELGLGEERVSLDLVSGGSDSGSGNESIDLRNFSDERLGRGNGCEKLTEAVVKLETPIARTLDLGKAIIAFQVSITLIV